MGSKMFLLLVLVLLMFIEHSQGAHEKHSQPLTISTSSTNASAVEELLTTADNRPPTTRRQHRRGCYCRGEVDVIRTYSKGSEMVTARCLCQQLAKRRGKHRKLKMLCRENTKNLKKCSRFIRANKGGEAMKMSPSVPI